MQQRGPYNGLIDLQLQSEREVLRSDEMRQTVRLRSRQLQPRGHVWRDGEVPVDFNPQIIDAR